MYPLIVSFMIDLEPKEAIILSMIVCDNITFIPATALLFCLNKLYGLFYPSTYVQLFGCICLLLKMTRS